MLGKTELGYPPRGGFVDVGLDQPGRILADRGAVGFAFARIQVGVKMEVIIGHLYSRIDSIRPCSGPGPTASTSTFQVASVSSPSFSNSVAAR